MRGKQHLRIRDQLSDGLIPAHAGKTLGERNSIAACPAHPRACGENPRASPACPRILGSSPRMRGKRESVYRVTASSGLIPAHAGKTHSTRRGHVGLGAHPRACGENTGHSRQICCTAGSSPRMRGKRGEYRGRWWRVGLIPAHAGKTSRRPSDTPQGQAHPRACGENAFATGNIFTATGSSPRMRGKPRLRIGVG